jgi:hypothetical protein
MEKYNTRYQCQFCYVNTREAPLPLLLAVREHEPPNFNIPMGIDMSQW